MGWGSMLARRERRGGHPGLVPGDAGLISCLLQPTCTMWAQSSCWTVAAGCPGKARLFPGDGCMFRNGFFSLSDSCVCLSSQFLLHR